MSELQSKCPFSTVALLSSRVDVRPMIGMEVGAALHFRSSLSGSLTEKEIREAGEGTEN